MRSFNDFYEILDHEFKLIDIKLTESGYKIDGNSGIKVAVGLEQYKSADYFAQLKNQSLIIEFSNLQHHLENVEYKKQAVVDGCSDLKKNDRSVYNGLLQNFNHEIKCELTAKFKDTVGISNKLSEHLIDVPAWVSVNDRAYFIIVSPFQSSENDLALQRKRKPISQSDFVRYLDSLAGKVKHDLPANTWRKVVVLTLDQFIQSLSF